MSIYVIEQGRRVATPFDALFPRTVQPVVRSARVDAVDGEAGGDSSQSPATTPEAAAGISAYREQSEQPPPRRQVSTAVDVMTPHPACLAPDAMVASAWQLMQQRGFHHVVVAAVDLTLLGIVSDRDIWELQAVAGLAAMATTRVDAVMISQVVCASAETSIRRLAEVMLLHKVDALPVIDDAQHVQGIVTRTDLLRALVLEAPLELWV
jgi:acetoin utilization protein AcuB